MPPAKRKRRVNRHAPHLVLIGRKKGKSRAKPRKPRVSRAWMLLPIPVVMALSLAAYILGSSNGHAVVARPLSELHYDPQIVATSSMGEAFTLEPFRYEVRGAVNRGTALGFQKAHGRFVQVVIAVQNTSASRATPHAISMIDSSGTQYALVPQFAKDDTSYSGILGHGLESSGAGTYSALFDVASKSSGLWLTFHAQDGFATRLVSLGM